MVQRGLQRGVQRPAMRHAPFMVPPSGQIRLPQRPNNFVPSPTQAQIRYLPSFSGRMA